MDNTIKVKFKDLFPKSLGKVTELTDRELGVSIVMPLEKSLKDKLKITKGKEYAVIVYLSVNFNDDVVGETNKFQVFIDSKFGLSEANGSYSFNYQYIKYFNKVITNVVSDDYFYDRKGNHFEDKKGKKLTSRYIVDHIYRLHFDISIRVRVERFIWKKIIANTCEVASNFLIYVLNLLYDEKIKFNIIERFYFKDKQNIDPLKKTETPGKKIGLFGYEASVRAVFSYCLLNLSLYFLFFYFQIKPHVLKYLFENSLLSLFYVIVSITFYEMFLPKIFKIWIEVLTNYYISSTNRKIRLD